MKTVNYLSMVALVMMGAIFASCEKIELRVDPVVEDNIVVCTTTLNIDAAGTKALASDGTKTFAADETMALVYKNTSGNTVKTVSAALTAGNITNEGKSATFSFELENPDKDQPVTYIYPAAMAKADGSVNYDALATQDGSLAALSSNLDLATYTGDWNAGSLPNGTLENHLAILAITLKDNATTPAEITGSITGMTIKEGSNTYTVIRSTAAGPIYVAIRPTASAAINISATDGTKNYVKILTGKTYAASNGYNVCWRMGQPINLAGLTANYEAQDGDFLTGVLDVDNHPVKISIAEGATVTLAGVTIEGVNDEAYEWAGINCIGDATIILADGTTNTVKGFYQDYPGIWIRKTYTLTINGTGSLVASSNGWGAGIGGGAATYTGNIRIEGGNITATGGTNCAGIGASCWEGGSITITGGYINASGDGGGAGIGCGNTDDATCGDITISGGTIIATGDGAGIGTGNEGTCGDITISGGTITANGGEGGAGIGAGNGGTCGDITIGGGTITITATGGEDGAGIGIGYDATCGDIYISGGTIEAAGNNDGTGIGCSGYGECGSIEITIDVTKVKATKGEKATHSIGFNLVHSSGITCGNVTIGGKVYWDGTSYQNNGDSYLAASPFNYPAP